MNQVQTVSLVAIVVLTGVLAARAFQKSQGEEREFFNTLVGALCDLLTAKGYRVTTDRWSQVMFLHLATFERGDDVIELGWDWKEREVVLLRNAPTQENSGRTETIARTHLPNGATTSHYNDAKALIVHAASRIGQPD